MYNRVVAERLRGLIYKLFSLPCEGSNPTMNISFVMFTCSVFLAAGLAAFKCNQA